jgi:hypothetical protein
MRFFLLLLIVAVVVAIIWLWLQGKKSSTGASSASRSLPPDIRRMKVGGVINLRGVGPELEDFDFVVDRRHLYVEDGFEWCELEATKGTGKAWLEVEDDDELCVSLCLEKLSLSDIGITSDDLARIERVDEGSITFQGEEFEYEDWGEAEFFRDGMRGKGERLKYWEFENETTGHSLAIERWGSGHFEVYLSENLRPSQYEVFTTEG